MKFKTRITELLGIEYPILQGGMRWAARAELAAAVGEAGGLGFISAHTQPTPADLGTEIDRVRRLTSRPFGVNLTLLSANSGFDYEGYATTIIDRGVPAVETAGSNPAAFIDKFRRAGIKVLHKCTTVRHAVEAEQLGADAGRRGVRRSTDFIAAMSSRRRRWSAAECAAAASRVSCATPGITAKSW